MAVRQSHPLVALFAVLALVAPSALAQSTWSTFPWENAVFSVSAIRIPSPFVSREGSSVDFTEVDNGLRELIDAAHEAGTRVLVDINLNSAGKPTQVDSAWTTWWGPGWVRADLPGYTPCGDEPVTACTNGQPDFRTEIGEPVDVPAFLLNAWGPERAQSEQRKLDDWFTRTRYPRTPRHYLVKWMADLVREYGADGFFAIDAEYVDVALWSTLKAEASQALSEWRTARGIPTRGAADFWLTTDVEPEGPIADALFSVGFSALPMWLDPGQLVAGSLDSLYASRAAATATAAATAAATSPRRFTAQLRLEDHESGDEKLSALMSTFLLLPGAVALPSVGSSAQQSSWADVVDFRIRHPAVGAGSHQMIAAEPYTFQRTYRSGNIADDVIVVLGAEGRTRVNVSAAFPDDGFVRDALTGSTAFVSFGYVSLTPGESGMLLLELAE